MYSAVLLVLMAVLNIVLSEVTETGVAVNGWVALPHGPPMPQLGLGTAGLFTDTPRVVAEGLRRGLYLVDSAQAQEWYDEAGAARALQALPADIPHHPLVVVKIHPRSFAFDAMESRLRDSEARFLSVQADQNGLDVVLLHSPFCWQGHCNDEQLQHGWKEAWENLEILKREGRVKNIGVSNFDLNLLTQLGQIANSKVAVIQNWMDPFHQDREVREFAAANGIAYMAYSSFGTQWGAKFSGNNPVFDNAVLNLIANRHNKSVAQVVLSWLLQEGVVAIPRSKNTAHMDEFASLLETEETASGYPKVVGVKPFLSEVDMRLIRQLDGTLGDLWE